MYPRCISPISGIALAALALVATVVAAEAAQQDKKFFQSIAGNWKGPGEIVAGKYKGTKFTCDLTGEPEDGSRAGIKLEGTCRVGVFKQPMSAVITQSGASYKGQFLDGAAGKGLDVVSGAVSGDKVVLGINRSKLNGAMIARIQNDNAMKVTISVKVESQMIPVIGVTLNRQAGVDDIKVGSIK